MYTPKHFQVPAKDTLLKILPEASFVNLITYGDDGTPEVTHLPVSYEPGPGGDEGVIIGHMARANPHWKLLEARPSLVIFNGPHHYISPTDYRSDVNVPTWNYVAVHATGQARLLEGVPEVRRVLDRLTAENESGRENPWSLEGFDEKRLAAMMKAIVAFEIPVDKLQAKAKLAQNKSEEDRKALASAVEGTELGGWQKSVL